MLPWASAGLEALTLLESPCGGLAAALFLRNPPYARKPNSRDRKFKMTRQNLVQSRENMVKSPAALQFSPSKCHQNVPGSRWEGQPWQTRWALNLSWAHTLSSLPPSACSRNCKSKEHPPGHAAVYIVLPKPHKWPIRQVTPKRHRMLHSSIYEVQSDPDRADLSSLHVEGARVPLGFRVPGWLWACDLPAPPAPRSLRWIRQRPVSR